MGKGKTSAIFYRRGVTNNDQIFGAVSQGNYYIVQPSNPRYFFPNSVRPTPIPNLAIVTTTPSITRTSNGDYWVYTFTDTTQTYSVNFSNVSNTNPISFNILAVGGGGGGGNLYGGGGGGGHFNNKNYQLTTGVTFNINIGSGGSDGARGFRTLITYVDPYTQQTIIKTILGGGAGSNDAGNGGNSGSENGIGIITNTTGGSGNINGGGGGAGAGENGSDSSNTHKGGNGGNGFQPNLPGLPKNYYGGGGGGGADVIGLGGNGGGGNGGGGGIFVSNGTPNTGGGGGGGSGLLKGSGGSGVVVIAIPKAAIV
jgi:hypothetical protein